MKPYTDRYINDDIRIRRFKENVSDLDLVWHQDKRDRTVEVLNGKGWKFQFENQIPIELSKSSVVTIPKMKYHRIIKGTTPLTIKITEHGR
jgi:hypothetical protein